MFLTNQESGLIGRPGWSDKLLGEPVYNLVHTRAKSVCWKNKGKPKQRISGRGEWILFLAI